jgi:hypothetical protein
VEENGLLVLSSLLSTSKVPAVLDAALHCLGVFVRYACMPLGGGLPKARGSLLGSPGQPGREAGNVLLLERSRAVPGAVRLAAAHECAEFSDTAARSISSAALDLLLKVAAVPEMRTRLRWAHFLQITHLSSLRRKCKDYCLGVKKQAECLPWGDDAPSSTCSHAELVRVSCRTAGLMSALATIMTPGGADTAALLERAIQLVAALASDVAAAVEFTAGGGVLGLLAIVSDSSAKVSVPVGLCCPSVSAHFISAEKLNSFLSMCQDFQVSKGQHSEHAKRIPGTL